MIRSPRLSSRRGALCASRLQQPEGVADWLYVDTKRLHRAIKELRAELDRVNSAIKQIEAIAELMGREHQADGHVSRPKRRALKPRRDGRV